ncbi:MAG: hypothetical protein HHJ11_00345 [Phycicoccus sp.]|nr:hypothetical protein [Phycicoccus sp.]NMM35846.1 hypothetical protein [Phycicoccus sp.]
MLGQSAPAVALAALLALAIAGGLPLSSALRALAALLLTQILPGALIWRMVRPRNGSWLEDLAMGFAIGSTIAIGAQIVASFSRMPWLSWGFAVGLVILLVGLPASRGRILAAETSRLPWWFGAFTSLTIVAAVPQLLTYFRQVPLAWTSGYRRPNVDAYLHLALSGELAHRGPVTFPWVASEPLAYHWFSHAWVANLSVVSGVELDEMLFRFMPVFLPLAVALIVGTAALRLTGRAWTGPLAATLTLAAGDLNVFGVPSITGALAPLSPSLGLSVPMLVAIVVVLRCRWQCEARSGAILLIPLLAIAAAGTKGSTLPLVVAGLGMAVGAAMLFDRSRLRTLTTELAVVIGCLGFALLVIFHGSEAGLRLDPRHAPEFTALFRWLGGLEAVKTNSDLAFIDVVVILGVLARGAGLLLLLATRQGRRDPLTWLLTGGSLAGAAALATFTHPGNSQFYFAISAIPLLALGSAVGLASLIDRTGAKILKPVLTGLAGGVILLLLPSGLIGVLTPVGSFSQATKLLEIAGAVLLLVGLLAALMASPGRTAFLGATVVTILAASVTTAGIAMTKTHRPDAPPVRSGKDLAVSRDEIEAARWIRDHSSIEDMVMTNRHCVTPTAPEGGCDSRRWVVAAFSERQVLLEGWTATPRSTDLAPEGRESITIAYWKPELLTLNDGFIARPDAEAAAKLSAMGVNWVYVDYTRPHAKTLEPFAHLRFHTPGADVYELPKAG